MRYPSNVGSGGDVGDGHLHTQDHLSTVECMIVALPEQSMIHRLHILNFSYRCDVYHYMLIDA